MAQAAEKIEFTDDQLNKAKAVFSDFLLFCRRYLKISDFNGNIVPLVPNKPQERFIKTILKQWQDEGQIRVIIAKARKMGFSTIITAFMFWQIVTKLNRHGIAGTHHESTNDILVNIFNTFYKNYPKELRPTVGSSNASGMTFKQINSSYEVLAASNVEKVGRGFTGQMLHISEIAHINNADQLAGSLLSAIGTGFVKDSMIFLESTANGTGNFHHSLFQKARNREPGCPYIAFFAPWFEDERYQIDVPEGFILNDEEQALKKRYDLTDRQIAWRRSVLSTMHGTEKQALSLFKQEYPSNEIEAFQYSKTDSFLDADLIIEAINRPQYGSYTQSNVAIIAGYDPSQKSRDADAFVYRQGANLWGVEERYDFGEDIDARVNYCKEKLDNKIIRIDMLFIDAGGQGYAIHSRLVNDGYGDRVRRIEFGSGADNPIEYPFKRDEMFGRFRDLLTDKHNPLSISVSEDLKDKFIGELTATGYKLDNKNRPKMESKEEIKKRGIPSTNMTDAAILTTAQKIVRTRESIKQRQTTASNKSNPFRSLGRQRYG